jgi:hypothetical protein
LLFAHTTFFTTPQQQEEASLKRNKKLIVLPHTLVIFHPATTLVEIILTMPRFSYLVLVQLVLVACSSAQASEVELCEQLHLSFTGVESSMSIDFVSPSEESAVIYYRNQNDRYASNSIISTTSSYFDEIGWLHYAEMRELVSHEKYMYKISIIRENEAVETACTNWIEFEAGYPIRPDGTQYRIGDSRSDRGVEGGIAAVYADFGLANDVSMKHLQEEGLREAFDYALHIGDISYDLFTNKSTVGNEFMRQVSAVYKHKPLMVAAGNHEHNDNFTQYTQRFKAQQMYAGANSRSGTSFYYSFDVGFIHYVVINTEVYKYQNQTASSPLPFTPEEQLAWLEEDLKLANKNRENVPWIVMAGHKGWYMNEFSGMACIFYINIVYLLTQNVLFYLSSAVSYKINGAICTNFTAFDDLSCQYGVDLYLTGAQCRNAHCLLFIDIYFTCRVCD